MVYKVSLDARGRANGVHYVDTTTGMRYFAHGRSVVLAASTCETARILLNSKNSSFPDGLANSSGQVGRNLSNPTLTLVSGTIPALQGLKPFNDDGMTIGHAYVPWWGHREQATGKLPFATEYHIQLIGGRKMPMADDFVGLPAEQGRPLYGHKLRDRLRHEFGSRLELLAVGGMIPNEECRCEIDPSVKDRWDIPVLRFHWKWGQQEIEQTRHAERTLSAMISAMGGTPQINTGNDERTVELYHEAGTARMGASPGDSPLNGRGHAWDVRNLYVADGASFTGHADKNPTHTIMALAWRASDHLADSFVRKEI
jgi:choline dehydrogenase-like flavoprotein